MNSAATSDLRRILDALAWFCECFGWRCLLLAPPMLMLFVVLAAVDQIRGDP